MFPLGAGPLQKWEKCILAYLYCASKKKTQNGKDYIIVFVTVSLRKEISLLSQGLDTLVVMHSTVLKTLNLYEDSHFTCV